MDDQLVCALTSSAHSGEATREAGSRPLAFSSVATERASRSRGGHLRLPLASRRPVSRSPDDWSERVDAWVERSSAKQGVPVRITDPLVLRQVAELLSAHIATATL